MGAADEGAVGDEVLVADRDTLAARKADRVPLAVDVEQAQVLAQLEALEGGGGVDDQVKGHLVRLVPALLRRGQEAVGAHLLGILLLGTRTRDGPDLGAQGLGEQNTVVAQATDTDDSNLLARAGAVALQGAVHGDTGAQHRSGIGAGHVLWDGVDP